MINRRFGKNPYPQLGDTDIGFYADHCHMNCYQYLSAWIHFASQLVNQFSLSYDDTVGLVIGMYCDNNTFDFVEVAQDLLKEDGSIVTESTSNLGLSVCKRMVDKKFLIKNKYRVSSTFLLLLATK
jgi:hypothetical protein